MPKYLVCALALLLGSCAYSGAAMARAVKSATAHARNIEGVLVVLECPDSVPVQCQVYLDEARSAVRALGRAGTQLQDAACTAQRLSSALSEMQEVGVDLPRYASHLQRVLGAAARHCDGP